jgi:hypothetical protein
MKKEPKKTTTRLDTPAPRVIPNPKKEASKNACKEKNWKELLGDNLIETDDYTEVSHIIANIVLKHSLPKEFVLSSNIKKDETIL